MLAEYAGQVKNLRFKVSDEETICVEKANGIVCTIALNVVGATVDLSGINFDEVQNIALNAKIPPEQTHSAL